MDISELQLKINKNKAVDDLKSVEKQLEKTGSAADELIEVLKDIGLTVGFGKLLNDSLQLNNQFTALSSKFKSIFSDGFDTSTFSELKNELTLSDTALKNILSTTGQFAKGLGQSSQYVKNFSTDLTKAAADYAAYQGKTSAADVNEYARKFAKATLGEVGELKDIGIIIDTTSKQFANAVKEMAELTGTTEAQAKQMVIQKQLLEQVQIASGSASQNMYDGWAQLNKLFDQFKEVLAEVGGIFSKVLAPILGVLSGILEIPFVKSTAAWVVAIGGVVVGYTALMKTLNKLAPALNSITANFALQPKYIEKVKKLEEQILPILKQQAAIKEKIGKLNKGGNGTGLKDLMVEEKRLNIALGPFQKELKDLGSSILMLIPSIQGVSTEFSNFSNSLLTHIGIIKKTTAVHIGAIVGTKLRQIAEMRLAGTTSVLTVLFGELTKTFKALQLGIASFFKELAGGATGLAAVKVVFTTLLAAAGKLALVLAAVVAAFDLIKVVINLISGKEWNAGTITRWFAEWFYGIDEIEEESKKLSEANRTLYNNLVAVEGLKKKLEEIHLNEAIKNMLPSEAIKALQDKSDEMKIKMKNLAWIIDNFGEAKKRGMVDVPADDKGEYRKNLQEKLNQLTREYYTTQNEIKNKTKNLIDLNTQYAKTIDELGKQMQGIYSTFAYGYKNGQFGNYTEDQANLQRNIRLQELNEKYNSLIGKKDLQSMKLQKETLQEIFNLTREKAKYELDVLWKQRETAISNMKLMTDIVKQATGLRSSSQRFIEAASMEAISMQSRKYESMSKSELAPMIEQQKQIKVIETNMLKKQDGFDRVLNNIYNQLVEATKRIGKSQGVSGSTINAVNPL